MKNIIRTFLLIALMNLSALQNAYAEEEELLTAGELLANCDEGYTPGAPTKFCMKYVGDFVLMMMVVQQAEQSPPVFCVDPQSHALEDVTEKVHGYLRANSSRADQPAQDLVVEALNKNYPCSLTNKT